MSSVVRVDDVCSVYTCRRLIDLSLIVYTCRRLIDLSLIAGWPAIGRWLSSWFSYVVHNDDLDVIYEWRQHNIQAAIRSSTGGHVASSPRDLAPSQGLLAALPHSAAPEAPAVETPVETPKWAMTYLGPDQPAITSTAPQIAAGEWGLDRSGTVRFLVKDLHFLLKNVDFLLKNVDFIIKSWRSCRFSSRWRSLRWLRPVIPSGDGCATLGTLLRCGR